MLDSLLFGAFPYVAVILAIVAGLYRFRTDQFSYSSLSSQFLENRTLFWGSISWHYAILTILGAHLLALLFPGLWGLFLSDPLRLGFIEVTGLALGAIAVLALGALIVRRLASDRITKLTSLADVVLLAALWIQVVLGVWIALGERWGSYWSLYTAVPWVYSLLTLTPRVELVSQLPWSVKLHVVGAFVVIGIFPFTRLVHLVTWPIAYLWRPYQVVIWNRRRASGPRS